MRRLHLFELGDADWLPPSLRGSVGETLSLLTDCFHPYGEALELVADRLAEDRPGRIVDLCAGAGGPWRRLGGLLADRGHTPEVVLTDLHPEVPARLRGRLGLGDRVRIWPEPVDARRVPDELVGHRIMFNALHHFDADGVREIFADAARAGSPIVCLEVTERRWRCLPAIALIPLATLLVTPWLPPRRGFRLLWTYGIPAVPLITGFDGLVSCARSYRIEELLRLAREAVPAWNWTAGRAGSTWLPLRGTWILGHPTLGTPARGR